MGFTALVAPMNQELFLVRHGETAWSEQGRLCGRSDPPLTEQGRQQATTLRALFRDEIFDSIVSSPTLRALETARLAYGEPSVDDRICEIDFGDLEGRTWMECSDEVQQRLLDYESFEAPGGESVRHLGDRVLAALHDLGPGRHLVFTHGGVIRFLTGRAPVTEYPGVATVTCLRMEMTTRASGGLAMTCELIPHSPTIAGGGS
jgi:probable phosphoglycerate mutase